MFSLSKQYRAKYGSQTLAMFSKGELFEAYVLGFKDNKNEDVLIGRKDVRTVNLLKSQAEYVAPIFREVSYDNVGVWKRDPVEIGKEVWYENEVVGKVQDNDSGEVLEYMYRKIEEHEVAVMGSVMVDEEVMVMGDLRGKAYQYMEVESESSIVRGEADYIGDCDMDYLREIAFDTKVPDIGKAIWDLKWTGDISRVWDFKNSKEDYLQAGFYPYMHWRKTGEVLPFVYLVVDGRYEVPIVRVVRLDVDMVDYEYFVEPLVRKVENDFMYWPRASKENCLGGYGEGQCMYLEWCEHGRKVIGGFRKMVFNQLYQNERL